MKSNSHLPSSYGGSVQFILSAAGLRDMPEDIGAEVAFLGRSNSGKSTAINALVNRKREAFVSKRPGCTQLINFFSLEPYALKRLVDLPGYGYAEASRKKQKIWEDLVVRYLSQRLSLRGLILLMDIRHPLKDSDQNLLHWTYQHQIPVHILLSKADKLSKNLALRTLEETSSALTTPYPHCSVQIFSSLKKLGLEKAWGEINEMLTSEDDKN